MNFIGIIFAEFYYRYTEAMGLFSQVWAFYCADRTNGGNKRFMLNYLWIAMLILGLMVGAVTGHMQEISNAVVTSAQDAVDLCITMLGIMAVWTGVMKIAQTSGLLQKLSRILEPVIRFLFPNLPKDHPAAGYISTNCVANILGLGWAATPAGLKAMEELENLEDERRKNQQEKGRGKKLSGCVREKGIASNEMCTFLILNISSLQLIPVSIIAYRSQYGSANPAAIVGPAILATAVSTGVAVIFCRIMDRKQRR